MFVRAYRLQGESIYHGSNTIWRKYLSDKGALTSVRQLRPGMAVFKWKAATPEKFHDGLGDFYHIGLVTQVNPLRIVHASTTGMQVRADTRLGNWSHWGWLSALPGLPADSSSAAPSSTSPAPPLLRRGATGEFVRLLQDKLTAQGFSLAVDGVFGRETRRAVRAFQAEQGLAVDGIVGPVTWAALGVDA